MAKRGGRGRDRQRGSGGRPGGPRPGRRERGSRRAREGTSRRPVRIGESAERDLEGGVTEILSTSADGQWLAVEDGEGVRWRVECLGDPVEIGARVRFASIRGSAPGESDREGPVGELIRVLEPARSTWVVRVVRPASGPEIFVIPFAGVETPRLTLAERDAKGAEDGERVIVVPLRPDPGKRKNAEGGGGGASRSRRHRGLPEASRRGHRLSLAVKVVERLGPAGDPTADHRALLWKHGLDPKFSRRARLEAESIEEGISPSERERRLDLTHLPFITIDPATARDFDDAVYAEERPPSPDLRSVDGPRRTLPRAPGWHRRLWVAIADVSHFVAKGGFIDSEARRRGNSFYFPDRAIPMLPERLSSDLCSLRPAVDRYAMVVELRIGADGQVADSLFHEAVIRSHARLSYEEAAAWFESGAGSVVGPRAGAAGFADSLRCLGRIADDLGRHRKAAGALMLELPEIGIVVDEEGHPIDARVRERNRAHILIEEAMLAANRAVARALDRSGRVTIHRVHSPPSPRKLEELSLMFERFGIDVPGDLAEPGVLSAALRKARGLPSEERLNMAALRSMSQARYQVASEGHYALRFDHYLHFTSPIRRYADLEVHRALRRLIRGEPGESEQGGAKASEEADRAERLAIWLSGRERVAAEVERDAVALASCALMSGREGESFEAEVTGATEFGLFVRLAQPAVSGLVPIRMLDGRWELSEDEEALVRAGHRIRVGEVIRVRLVEVDPDRARLSFRPIGRLGKSSGGPGGGSSRPHANRGRNRRDRRRQASSSSAIRSERISHSS